MGQLSDLGAHTFRSSLAALSVRTAQALISLGAIAVLARLLSPEDFGVAAMVVPFVILMNSLGNQGFQTTLIQSDELRPEQTAVFFRFAVRANIVLTIGFFAASLILAWFYGDSRVILLSAAWALLVCVLTLTAFQEAMLKRQMRFPLVLLIQLAGLVAGVACAIAAARLGAGYWSFLVQAIVVELVRVPGIHLAGNWRPDRSAIRAPASPSPLRSFWRSLAGFRVASWVSEQPDRLLVGRLGGAGTLGIYDTAQRWSSYAFVEPFLSLSDIAVVSLSRVRGDAGQYRLFFVREAQAILSMGLPVIAFIAAEPASVVRVLLGPQWDVAVPFVRLLAVAAFFGAFTRLTQWVYFSWGTTDRLLRWWLRVQTPVLTMAVLIGSVYGPRGVAFGYTAATLGLALPSIRWCVRGTPLTAGAFLRAASRPALASAGAALLLVAVAPLLPWPPGPTRFAVSLGLFVLCFVLGWLGAPGGSAAARDLVAAVRELKARSTTIPP